MRQQSVVVIGILETDTIITLAGGQDDTADIIVADGVISPE